jgi:2-amino-4-hydroxy-6-hydroxymethyldihydropteridine diphosphokinase
MIFIGVGSSIGNAKDHFDLAEAFLKSCGIIVLNKAKNIITEPFGGVAKNKFTNSVWQIETSFSPVALLKILQSAEQKAERKRDVKWGDRTLDLDILCYHGKKIESKMLKIPHPEIKKRHFVLAPWAEITSHKTEIPHLGNIHKLLKQVDKD